MDLTSDDRLAFTGEVPALFMQSPLLPLQPDADTSFQESFMSARKGVGNDWNFLADVPLGPGEGPAVHPS